MENANVKQKLDSIISEMSSNYWLFTKNPGHDFMRQEAGKLSFEDTIRLVLSMDKGTTDSELLDFFRMDADRIPTQSAFIQRRNQIPASTFEYLFKEFARSFPQTTNALKEKCVLAFDGTHIVYTTNAEILQDYNKPRLIDYKGYNHMHLNGFADVNSKAFLDVLIQPGQQPDEREAMHTMLDHFKPDDPKDYIITADRGYESYDMIFHCESRGFYYCFRVKSPSSATSMLSSYIRELPDDQEEFDVTIRTLYTDKRTKIMKEQEHVYHYINPNKNVPHFYEMLKGRHLVYIAFRVLKIKTSDGIYEYIITNLPNSFTPDDVKECYHMRWGLETAFRYLKHAAGLLYFHSKKPEFIKQEIYARLVIYNLGVFLANEAADENRHRKRKDGNKFKYEIDFSTAIRTALKYFREYWDREPTGVIKLLSRYVHAVKDRFRSFARPLRGIGAINFNYR